MKKNGIVPNIQFNQLDDEQNKIIDPDYVTEKKAKIEIYKALIDNLKDTNNLYDPYRFKHLRDKLFSWEIYDYTDPEIKNPIPIEQIREKYKKFK